MSPETLKQIEKVGARKVLLDSLISANSDLTEAINSYRQVEDTFYQAHTRKIEFAKQIKENVTKITVLIDHLQTGT